MLTFSGCRLLFIQDADNETITVLLSFPSIVRASLATKHQIKAADLAREILTLQQRIASLVIQS